MIWWFLYGLLAGLTYNFLSTVDNDEGVQEELQTETYSPVAKYTAKILLALTWPFTWVLIFVLTILTKLRDGTL